MPRGEKAAKTITNVSSGDDTDYEVEDLFKDLDPSILDTHLNSSSLTGESVISSSSSVNDVVLLEKTSFKRENNDAGYDCNKYFRKKRRVHSDVSQNEIKTESYSLVSVKQDAKDLKQEYCETNTSITVSAVGISIVQLVYC